MSSCYFVVPAGIDDPLRPTGGNIYDAHVVRELTALGWDVSLLPAPGSWPHPDRAAERDLERLVRCVPADSVVLIDGLIASAAASVLVPEADRLRIVVLVHMPLGASGGEAALLSAASAVITTSAWTRDRLMADYKLQPQRIYIAQPGVDSADLAVGTSNGNALICVGAISPHKGQDVLLDALTQLVDVPWRCTCVGALDRDHAFVDRLRARALTAGVADRFSFPGPRTGMDLDEQYASADALVLPSRGETYGMVVTEALARGLPVIATAVGGVPAAIGSSADGRRPGILVPPDSPADLAAALRRWLGEPELRRNLRSVAHDRRATLIRWETTGRRIADALTTVTVPFR